MQGPIVMVKQTDLTVIIGLAFFDRFAPSDAAKSLTVMLVNCLA